MAAKADKEGPGRKSPNDLVKSEIKKHWHYRWYMIYNAQELSDTDRHNLNSELKLYCGSSYGRFTLGGIRYLVFFATNNFANRLKEHYPDIHLIENAIEE